MSDPLTDPRAQDLLGARPGVIDDIASTLRRVAQIAQDSADGLQGAQRDLAWQGQAADNFRTTIGKAPPELDKISESYHSGATAIQAYGDAIAPLQSQFRSVAQQLAAARRHAANAAGRAHADAHDEVTQLEGRARAILDQFDGHRGTVHGALSDAAGLAPKNPPWWERALGAVGNALKDAGITVLHGIENIGKDIIDLPHDVVELAEHPSWSNLAKVGEDLAAVATVALVFTGLGELGFAALDIEAADEALVAVSEAADVVNDGAQAIQTIANTGQTVDDIAHGRTDKIVGDLEKEGEDVAFAKLTDELPSVDDLNAAKDGEEALNQIDALSKLDSAVGDGSTPVKAFIGLSKDDRSAILAAAGKDSITDIGSPAQQAQFLRSLNTGALEQAATHTAAHALPVKALGNVVEQLQDKLKEHYQDLGNEALNKHIDPVLGVPAGAE